MAHTKSGGSTENGRDSRSQRLGIKVNQNEQVSVGEIIIRQRGSKYLAGANVKVAGDDTLYAMKNGVVKFLDKKKTNFDRSIRYVKVVLVEEIKK